MMIWLLTKVYNRKMLITRYKQIFTCINSLNQKLDMMSCTGTWSQYVKTHCFCLIKPEFIYIVLHEGHSEYWLFYALKISCKCWRHMVKFWLIFFMLYMILKWLFIVLSIDSLNVECNVFNFYFDFDNTM